MTIPVLSEPNPVPSAGMGLILALGVTQVAGYGALYYAFAVLAPGMTDSLAGPSQVTGCLIEMLFGTNVPPVTTAWVSGTLTPLGFALLVFGSGMAAVAGLFAIAYGFSMGLSSIVRGTVPL